MSTEKTRFHGTALELLFAAERLVRDDMRDDTERLEIVQHVGTLADQLQVRLVAQWRAAGRTWQEIGTAFGTTRQAVTERFADRIGTEI